MIKHIIVNSFSLLSIRPGENAHQIGSRQPDWLPHLSRRSSPAARTWRFHPKKAAKNIVIAQNSAFRPANLDFRKSNPLYVISFFTNRELHSNHLPI
ncbi:hypothetical protein AOT13_02730 [Parageobacillus thermoglucosidasius]|nr:hypothetical protein AOT13_02730 [Parageobacillus thermoglucosidasius]KJX67790.1 hypothetical protein WH82_15680 [Parageobacillus thermoglucosidasius]